MKIYVVLTGGTIACSVTDGIISANEKTPRALEMYSQEYGGKTEFHITRLLNILSENASPEHWKIIADHILGTDLSGYDGVMILHGSDTLSYSSAFLGTELSSLNIPVVITASDLVPDDPESNAVENIRAAVLCIVRFRKGIFTAYKNRNDSFCSVYLSTRIVEADRVFGNFTSFDGSPFAYVENNRLELSGTVTESEINSNSGYAPALPFKLKSRVLMLRQYPGIDYSDVLLSENVSAVLLITYHSSSASTLGNGSALELLHRCTECGKEFFLASFDRNKTNIYETSDILLKNGARPLYHISNEAAYAKLLIRAELPQERREDFLEKNIFFEYI